MKQQKQGFSIIEILVGMFIFSLGIISVYAVLTSSVKINDYNKHYIVAANLAREQLELIRINRDYNYKKLQKFDQINPANGDFSNVFEAKQYMIYNDFSPSSPFPIKIIPGDITDQENFRLCFNETEKTYNYCSQESGNKKTPYYRYIDVKRDNDNQIFISSKVIWKARGVHEYEVNMILADWKQL